MDIAQIAGPSGPTTAPAGAVEGSTEPASQAAFNPFGTIGIAVQRPVPVVPHSVEADWALPVGVAIAGFAFIGWLLRAMVR